MKTDETIFTRAVKAFSFNAIRTKHSGLVFSYAGSSRKPSFALGALGALKNSFHPEAANEKSGKRERERREGLNENPPVNVLPVCGPLTQRAASRAFLLSTTAETGRPSWLAKSRSFDAECAIDRSLTRKSATDSTSLIMRGILRLTCWGVERIKEREREWER